MAVQGIAAEQSPHPCLESNAMLSKSGHLDTIARRVVRVLKKNYISISKKSEILQPVTKFATIGAFCMVYSVFFTT